MLSWKVLICNINSKKIEEYDIFKGGYYEGIAKELKKATKNKQEFSKEFRSKLMYRFWSRSEYEITATSSPPYIEEPDLKKLQNEVDEYEKRWGKKPYVVNVPVVVDKKIDAFYQLDLNWEQFIDYVWRNV